MCHIKSTLTYGFSLIGLTKISVAKKMAMTSAIKTLEEAQKSTISNLKADRFLADADWDVVMLMSAISNPYADRAIAVSRTLILRLKYLHIINMPYDIL